MNQESIRSFEKVMALLHGLYEEISLLTKKTPNSALNEFKIKFVNLALNEANELLGKNYQPFADFAQFEVSSLPTSSDVTMILCQYLNCMENLRSDNIEEKEESNGFITGMYWFWKETKIRTGKPKKV